MASYDIQPLQLRILDILLALYKVCKEHYQRHYFWAGTMLGVIRHKGYIPWDDDIDMIMLREDYGRLMPLADEFEHTYFLQNVYTVPHYTHRHAQLRNSLSHLVILHAIIRKRVWQDRNCVSSLN